MLARIRRSIDENDEGFTLIELLVVIIIIGILAAIAIPVFLNQRKKGYEASMKSDLRTVANEEETYNTDNQKYIAVTANTPPARTVVVGPDTVTLSTGNTIASTLVGVNGYCLKATSTQTSVVWFYDSAAGGLTKTDCSSSTAYGS